MQKGCVIGWVRLITVLGATGLILSLMARDDAAQFRMANAYWTAHGPTHTGAVIYLLSLIATVYGGLFLFVEMMCRDE